MIFEQQNVKDCENLLRQRNASFTLRHWLTSARVPVADMPMAATQIESKARAVLNALSSISIKKGSSPTEIRALRKLCGNPFDFPDLRDVDVRDITIPVSDTQLHARFYTADNHDEPAPCMVFYHGGGFVIGDLDTYDNMLKHIAKQANVRIVSVAYRLAPEHPFPGPVNDTLASYQWLQANAATLNLDPDRFVIAGDSAGANLATVACLLMREQSLSQPLMQLLIYPCTMGNNSSASRQKYAKNVFLTQEAMDWFHGHYIDTKQEQDYRFNVLGHSNLEALPPAFVITAGFDPLRDEGWHYTQALRAAGVEAAHCCFTDVFHGFMNYGLLPQAKAAVEECSNVLRAVLTPEN